MIAGLAAQLARPSGLRGRLVGVMLNRGNRGVIAGAVEAASIRPGSTVADLGFGGGLGLQLLLDAVGEKGQVHGVDLSTTMLARAERAFRREVGGRRLHLHAASMAHLPLADGSIDGLITINTIYFIAELDRAFGEVARVLSGAGRAVVGIGDPAVMARMPTTPYGFTVRPVDEVVSIAKSSGLRLSEHRRAGQGDGAAHLLVFLRM